MESRLGRAQNLLLWPGGLFLWPHQIQTPHRGGSLSLRLKSHDLLPHPPPILPRICPSSRAPFCLLQEAFLPQSPPSTILGPGENSFFLEVWFLAPPNTQPKAKTLCRRVSARAGRTYQQRACLKVPSPHCLIVGCCDNSGNKMMSIGSL